LKEGTVVQGMVKEKRGNGFMVSLFGVNVKAEMK